MAVQTYAEGEYTIGELPFSELRRRYVRNQRIKRVALYVAPLIAAAGIVAGSLYFARSEPPVAAVSNVPQSGHIKSKSIDDTVTQGTISTKEDKPVGQQPAANDSGKNNYL